VKSQAQTTPAPKRGPGHFITIVYKTHDAADPTAQTA